MAMFYFSSAERHAKKRKYGKFVTFLYLCIFTWRPAEQKSTLQKSTP
jgi:hypothetical protein